MLRNVIQLNIGKSRCLLEANIDLVFLIAIKDTTIIRLNLLGHTSLQCEL